MTTATTTISYDAVVLSAPFGATRDFQRAVEHSFDHMTDGAVLAVPCDRRERRNLIDWCRDVGRAVRNPSDWERYLLIENTTSMPAAAS